MFPVLFQIGPFTFYTYGFFIALGILLGMKISVFMSRAEKKYSRNDVEESLYSLLIYLVVGGLIGGRLFYAVTHRSQFADDFFSIVKFWEGGLVFYGGLFGAVAGLILWRRKNKIGAWLKILDWLAPGLAFGHALGRLGCFFAGCCYGNPTHHFLSVTFENPRSLAPIGIPLHPTQIYEFLFLLFLGGFLIWKTKRKIRNAEFADGAIFLDYLIYYSLGRFALDFLRGDEILVLGLSPGQVTSIIVFFFSLFFKNILKRRSVSVEKAKRI